MKVCALISGGKDSFYSIIECTRLGHQVVALANLHPPRDGGDNYHKSMHTRTRRNDGLRCCCIVPGDEMDSFCFQTVGHDVIAAYSECLGLPLIRQELRGTAVNQVQPSSCRANTRL